MASESPRWLAGLAVKASASTSMLALTLALAANAAMPSVSQAATPSDAQPDTAMAAHAMPIFDLDHPTNHVALSDDNASLDTAATAGFDHIQKPTLDAKVSVAALLSKYSHLPEANIAVVGVDQSNPQYQFQSPQATFSRYGCSVVIPAFQTGADPFLGYIHDTMGVNVSKALGDRVEEYAILHELGHCDQFENSAIEFSHPSLTTEQNHAIALGLSNAPAMMVTWQESYADAYSILTILDQRKADPKALVQTLADASFVKSMREMWRDNSEAVQQDGSMKLVFDADSHMTENTIKELTSNPEIWMDPSSSISERAAKLASIGLVRSVKQSADPDALAATAFDPMEAASSRLIDAARYLMPLAEQAKKDKLSEQSFLKSLDLQAPDLLIKAPSLLTHPNWNDQAEQATLAHLPQLAHLAYENASPGRSPTANLARMMAATMAARLPLDIATKAAGKLTVDEAPAAMAAWGAATAAESKADAKAEPAGYSVIEASSLEGEKEFSLVKSFWTDESKLSRWRAAKHPGQASPESSPVAPAKMAGP